ncbi:hypothetical protein LIER_27070 [Lithospermum erythrorhizon]|uniref:Uncharacterized protein n=1 Tax=Lithospermum erythrorhizon TaxID=34254 RepID=A0AAV3RAQ8_LITER
MTLDDYYNKLTGLFDELSRLKPPHSCSCGKCTCGVVARYENDREAERLHQFFVGIDDDLYGVVCSNLLSRLPMPSLDEAYNTFLQDENSKSIAHKKDEPDSFHAFAISSDRPLSSRGGRSGGRENQGVPETTHYPLPLLAVVMGPHLK